MKCEQFSIRYRNEGNALFRKSCDSDDNLYSALQLYNQALLFASVNSVEYMSALGNRSACLFEIAEYKACLRDIERVLILNNCPIKLKERLLKRKAKVSKCSENDKDCNVDQAKLPDSPKLSSSVKVVVLPKKGRSLVASKPIEPGEIVIVEPAFASVLLPQFASQFCHSCCKHLPLDPLPCTSCSENIYFCDEECQSSAIAEFHWAECNEVEKLANLGITHLAYRCFMACPKTDLIKYSGCVEQTLPENVDLFKTDLSSNFDCVVALESHHSLTLQEDIQRYAQAADGLIKLLNKKKYFEAFENKAEVEKASHAILVGLIERLICNAHAINFVQDTVSLRPGHLIETEQLKIASALYPIASVMNHSCIPNIFSSFQSGNVLVVRAVSHIPIGEELLNCYGPRFGRINKDLKKESLQTQYFFNCDCVACNDLNYINQELAFDGYKCSLCSNVALPINKQYLFSNEFNVKCIKCSHISNVNVKRTDEYTSKDIPELRSVYHKYNKKLMLIIDRLAMRMASDNPYEAVFISVINLDAVVYWFGDKSIEYAEELIKFISLLSMCPKHKLFKNLESYVKTANEIHGIYYGTPCKRLIQYT